MLVRVSNDFMGQTLRACASADRVELCAKSLRARRPPHLSRYDVERDHTECEYKARLANDQHFYSQGSPFPFSSSPQSSADHVRALHGLSTINAMWDTCLTAKGYRLN